MGNMMMPAMPEGGVIYFLGRSQTGPFIRSQLRAAIMTYAEVGDSRQATTYLNKNQAFAALAAMVQNKPGLAGYQVFSGRL